ncbi:ATP-grasp fold amidoligase family protein [Mesorhizobium comanense]|uniref:ATP-grasp fold amidoligase family protein n=1 Tax=Mesorhizobium comanense TaxID=2502215 RepID=UPI0010F753B7|nr:ATP-grasp fold amidoligase family protein [Mesorhizobium comanense]
MTAKADLSRTNRIVLSAARLWLTLRHPVLIVRFFMKLGYLPNPAAPTRYHELLLWRKILDRNPLFVTLTDKLAAKAYIHAICPEIAIPRTLWRGRDAADIPQDLLTGAVVVKANHGCAMNMFVCDGKPDRADIERKARRWLRKRYGRRNGEWAYWPVVPSVFVEERLALSGGTIATDIKVHVCSGVICHVWVEDKHAKRSVLFDRKANPLPGRDPDYPGEDQGLPVNARLLDHVRQAISMAPGIAGDLDYIRVDFLVTDDRLYAGEITAYSAAGYGTWTNPAIAAEIEHLWRIDQSAFLRRRHKGVMAVYANALRARYRDDAIARSPE